MHLQCLGAAWEIKAVPHALKAGFMSDSAALTYNQAVFGVDQTLGCAVLANHLIDDQAEDAANDGGRNATGHGK